MRLKSSKKNVIRAHFNINDMAGNGRLRMKFQIIWSGNVAICNVVWSGVVEEVVLPV